MRTEMVSWYYNLPVRHEICAALHSSNLKETSRPCLATARVAVYFNKEPQFSHDQGEISGCENRAARSCKNLGCRRRCHQCGDPGPSAHRQTPRHTSHALGSRFGTRQIFLTRTTIVHPFQRGWYRSLLLMTVLAS